MVPLEAVRSSNAKIRGLPQGLVALFVGGTSGIGESTAKQFCRHAVKPKVYLVGRNAESASRIINELKAIQAEGEYNFIQKDVTLLKNVDEVCNEIKSREKKINILFMTQGFFSFKGRTETPEGLDRKMAAHYYSRLRFTQNLLPALRAASPQLARVVSVFSPGDEYASFNPADLGLRSTFSLAKAANHCVVMNDLAFETLAAQEPSVSFVHAFPGGVKTGLVKEQSGLVRAAMNVFLVAFTPWMTPIDESGERHLYAATSARFPAREEAAGAAVDAGAEGVLRGSAGETGSGAYFVGSRGEFRGNEKVLRKLREEGMGAKIWEHTNEEFARIQAS